jgi:regulator of nucleoside diphosphate kinase
MNDRTIYVTTEDQRRLSGLLAASGHLEGSGKANLRDLSEELGRAVVVPAEAIPADVITMNSRFRLRDLDTGTVAEYTLVYPGKADFSRGNVSVLAPVGTALLGYRDGDTIEWRVPAGLKRLRIEALLYQPEAEATRVIRAAVTQQ